MFNSLQTWNMHNAFGRVLQRQKSAVCFNINKGHKEGRVAIVPIYIAVPQAIFRVNSNMRES